MNIENIDQILKMLVDKQTQASRSFYKETADLKLKYRDILKTLEDRIKYYENIKQEKTQLPNPEEEMVQSKGICHCHCPNCDPSVRWSD
jgi:hypothetical protein